MEKTEDRRPKTKELSDSSSSFIVHRSSFAVRTPTATVTDLGTEFGVEVQESGTVSAHVFRGVVQVQPAVDEGRRGQPIRLIENESIQVKKHQSGNEVTVHRGTADAVAFVRFEQLPGLAQEARARCSHAPRRALPIYDKTLVAWVSLDNLQQQGVGILSLVNTPEFDGIVFGELAPGKWMAGSHNFQRTERNQSAYPVETARPGELVQIAIVYDCTTITIYRNGRQYARYDTENRFVFERDSMLLMGKRYMAKTHIPTLAGAVKEVRLYDVALSPRMIAALKPNEALPIRPLGWWTFEDGTARDSTGYFPMGQLHGNAKIANGKLILDGADSYLLVPPALRYDQQPTVGARNGRQIQPKIKGVPHHEPVIEKETAACGGRACPARLSRGGLSGDEKRRLSRRTRTAQGANVFHGVSSFVLSSLCEDSVMSCGENVRNGVCDVFQSLFSSGGVKMSARQNSVMTFVAVLVVVGLALYTSPSVADTMGLVHRWSFNDGSANDSIGTANGTLYGGATISGGGAPS